MEEENDNASFGAKAEQGTGQDFVYSEEPIHGERGTFDFLSNSDFWIDAAVCVGLTIAAVVLWPVSIIAGMACLVTAAYIAWTTNTDGNVFNQSDRLLTSASILTLGSYKFLGKNALAIGGTGLGISFLSGFLQDVPLWVWLLLAVIVWYVIKRETSKQKIMIEKQLT